MKTQLISLRQLGQNKKKAFLLLGSFLFLGLFSFSCGKLGKNIKIPGMNGPHFKVDESHIQISTVFEKLNLGTGVRYNIPEYDGSYIELGPDLESSGTLLSISVKLDSILNEDLLLLEPQKLPGGRALPSVPSGELPSLAIHARELENLTFYLGKKVFGIFVPVKLGFDIGVNNIITTRYHSQSGVPIGTLSIVGADESGQNSGILLLLDMTKKTKKLIENKKFERFLDDLN